MIETPKQPAQIGRIDVTTLGQFVQRTNRQGPVLQFPPTPLIGVKRGAFDRSRRHPGFSKHFAVALYGIIIVVMTYLLVYFSRQAIIALPKIVETTVPAVVSYAEQHNIDLPFADYAGASYLRDMGCAPRIAVRDDRTVVVELGTVCTVPSTRPGGACVATASLQCDIGFASTINVTTSWQQFNIAWASFAQPTWSGYTVCTDKQNAIVTINFKNDSTNSGTSSWAATGQLNGSIYVDDLAFM